MSERIDSTRELRKKYLEMPVKKPKRLPRASKFKVIFVAENELFALLKLHMQLCNLFASCSEKATG